MTDTLLLILLLAFFGSVFFYVIFSQPESTKVFSASSDNEVYAAKKLLDANGIKTYIKSKAAYRMEYLGGLNNPSLHVLDPQDRKKALEILERGRYA